MGHLATERPLITNFFFKFILILRPSNKVSLRFTTYLKWSIILFMNFTKSIEVCFKKFATFDGRAKKSEFWWFQLFCLIVELTGIIFDHLMGYESGFFELVAYVIVLLPSLAVGARRLHDTGRSGWWQLLYLTIIGIIVLIVWWVADGDKKKNKFGEPIKL